MQVRTNVKAGAGNGINLNHNEAQVRAAAQELRVQTAVKAGKQSFNHNGVTVPGLQVETGVKAGAGKPPSDPPPPPPPG